MTLTPTISRTMTTIYDTGTDLDLQADRVDHIEQEEVMAYVPQGSKFHRQVIEALTLLAKNLNKGNLSGTYPDGSTDPPASP